MRVIGITGIRGNLNSPRAKIDESAALFAREGPQRSLNHPSDAAAAATVTARALMGRTLNDPISQDENPSTREHDDRRRKDWSCYCCNSLVALSLHVEDAVIKANTRTQKNGNLIPDYPGANVRASERTRTRRTKLSASRGSFVRQTSTKCASHRLPSREATASPRRHL